MRILFITSTRIGDAVLSTGLLNHLAGIYPKARFTIACGPAAAPLFAAFPALERLIAMPKEKRSGHWLKLWLATFGTLWDMVVDLRRSAISWLLLTKERRVLKLSKAKIHRLRLLADLFSLAEPPAPRLWTSPEAEAEAERFLPNDGKPILALGPTANWTAKTWRGENFVELAKRLTAPESLLENARIVLFGAPNEREAARPVIDGLAGQRLVDLIGNVDLVTVYACLKRASLYVGNDSGLMHMAAAANIPTIGLFGPSPEVHYAPWGEKSAVVRTAIAYEDIFGENFNPVGAPSLMDSLSVESVEDAALRLLDQRRAA
jgi:heptosyltransferase-3